ncbi:hypothetical protein NM688_g10 [Phlebia brevispora]|uniref:Uncharacterized protein n=1 Tax=Phlebia brevispora TaxID=194682 RepID=A0ACC1TFN8_9APHY|nr:hypothetical protein NM688_g10 [Phlebia brevispora]
MDTNVKNLSMFELARIARTQRDLRGLVNEELRVRHHRMLSHFMEDPDAFMAALKRIEAVLSGSFVGRYLQGEYDHARSDLDIYVPYQGFDAMKTYLTIFEGYIEDVKEAFRRRSRARAVQVRLNIAARLVLDHEGDVLDEPDPDFDEPPYTRSPVDAGITEVATLRKGDRKIDVVRNQSTSALYAITRFWSTLQMNYIGAHGFCCAYPSLTSQRVGIINPLVMTSEGVPRRYILPLIEKYSQRGYAFHDHWYMHIGHGCRDNHLHVLCPTKRHSFEDQYAFYGAFGSATRSSRFDSVKGASASEWKVGWRLGGSHQAGGFRCAHSARAWHSVTGEGERRSQYQQMVEMVVNVRDLGVLEAL